MLQQSQAAAQNNLQTLVLSHLKQDGFPHTHIALFLKPDYTTQQYFINKIIISTQDKYV